MPTCIICNTDFEPATRMDPHEPCDCGREFTRRDWRDREDFDLKAVRADWLKCKDMTPEQLAAHREANS